MAKIGRCVPSSGKAYVFRIRKPSRKCLPTELVFRVAAALDRSFLAPQSCRLHFAIQVTTRTLPAQHRLRTHSVIWKYHIQIRISLNEPTVIEAHRVELSRIETI